MKIEKLPSGSYRARKMYKGKRYTIVFDHKPTDKEVTIAFAEKMQDEAISNGSFHKCALEYIENRRNVISPATVRTYNTKIKQLSDTFKSLNIQKITREDVQKEINLFSETHEPKTVQSLHGFISSVMAAYRPSLALRTKLPSRIVKEKYEPSNDDIRRILDAAKGTRYSIPFQLGVFGCRRAEICALDMSDLKGNELRIHRSKVYLDGQWITKETPKTDESNRIIYLPDSLVQEIIDNGCIYDGYPAALYKAIKSYQKKLGIQSFRFHDLRSYFASYAHSLGIPDADIMALGGWKTDAIMKKVYRKSIEESKKRSMSKISSSILS